MTVNSEALRDALIQIGDEHGFGAIACVGVGATLADMHFMYDSKCPYRLNALRTLAQLLREMAEQADYTAEGMLADDVAKEFIE